MAKSRPQVVSIHHLLVSASETTKKVDSYFAQRILDNRKTKSMDFLTIFYDFDECIKFFRATIKFVSTRVSLEIDDIIFGSLIHTAA
jgi:hypothetical protein